MIVGPDEGDGVSPVKDKNSGLVFLSICVIVILLNDVDNGNVPESLNFGIADQRDLVQPDPVQYKIRTPTSSLTPPSSLNESAARLINVELSTVIFVPSIAILIIGTVINVLNLITSLFVVIGFS